MSWITPKTNWVNFDYFTYDDWNRISGNVEYITNLLIASGYSIDSFTPTYMLASGYPYIDLANKIANQINSMIDIVGLYFDKVAIRNSAECVWDSADLNNIEGVLLRIFDGGYNNWLDIYNNYTWDSLKTITWGKVRKET